MSSSQTLYMSGQPEKVTTQRYLAVDEAALLSSEFIANSTERVDANWTSAKHAVSRVTTGGLFCL